MDLLSSEFGDLVLKCVCVTFVGRFSTSPKKARYTDSP